MTEEEVRSQREKCADCGGALQEIKVRQNGHMNIVMPLTYQSADTKESKWIYAAQPVHGVLLAFMCSSCARIYFYGAANEQKPNTKRKPADADR